MLTFTRTSWRAFPRGVIHTVMANPVVRGNRFAISNSSWASGWENCLRGSRFPVFRRDTRKSPLLVHAQLGLRLSGSAFFPMQAGS
jgi:hypothetical protein